LLAFVIPIDLGAEKKRAALVRIGFCERKGRAVEYMFSCDFWGRYMLL
jgi:hypothetical protein